MERWVVSTRSKTARQRFKGNLLKTKLHHSRKYQKFMFIDLRETLLSFWFIKMIFFGSERKTNSIKISFNWLWFRFLAAFISFSIAQPSFSLNIVRCKLMTWEFKKFHTKKVKKFSSPLRRKSWNGDFKRTMLLVVTAGTADTDNLIPFQLSNSHSLVPISYRKT